MSFWDGSDVKVVEQELPHRGIFERDQAGLFRYKVLGTKVVRCLSLEDKRQIGNIVPALEVDQSLNVCGVILREDGNSITGIVRSVLGNVKGEEPDILPVRCWGNTFIPDKFRVEGF